MILGKAPEEPGFEEIFGADAVIEIDHANGNLPDLCESLWEKRECYLERALERRKKLSSNWSWEARIHEIMRATGLEPAKSEGQSEKR